MGRREGRKFVDFVENFVIDFGRNRIVSRFGKFDFLKSVMLLMLLLPKSRILRTEI